MNSALKKGKHLLITPGRYFLEKSLKVTKPGTVVMGIGLATLIPENGNAALEISDVDGVSVCGLTIDAGKVFSEKLFDCRKAGITARSLSKEVPQTLFSFMTYFSGSAVRMKVRPKHAWK